MKYLTLTNLIITIVGLALGSVASILWSRHKKRVARSKRAELADHAYYEERLRAHRTRPRLVVTKNPLHRKNQTLMADYINDDNNDRRRHNDYRQDDSPIIGLGAMSDPVPAQTPYEGGGGSFGGAGASGSWGDSSSSDSSSSSSDSGSSSDGGGSGSSD